MQKYSKNAFVNLRYVTANNHNVFKMADNDRAKNKEIIVLTKASDILIGVLLYQHEGLKVIPISNRDNNYAFVNKRIEEIKKENKNAVIYTVLLENNKENSEKKNYTCYFNTSRDLCIWKVE